jgi:phosphomannomutase
VSTAIRFGTDGWRGVVGREFTLANLRRVSQAICDCTVPRGAKRAAVGYDTRFLSRRFAEEVAGVLLGNGMEVILGERAHTTPALSCQVLDCGADLGLVVTASHNPPEFQGLKIKTAAGASASLELTQEVEAQIGATPPRIVPAAEGIGLGTLEIRSFARAHLDRMARVADLPRIRGSRLQVVVDSMHGAGGRIIEEMMAGSSTEVRTLRGDRDPLFGGGPPEPVRGRLDLLLGTLGGGGSSLGFATDGDGDRIAGVDETGSFLSPLRLVAILALHLIRRRKMPGGIAKTFANTIYLDRIAAAEGRQFHCLPVGFKHIAALLERGDLLIGGEESGGIGFAGYPPERDGLLAGLLLMEAVAESGKAPSVLVKELTEEFGDYHYDREDHPDPDGRLQERLERLSESPPHEAAGLSVVEVDARDGLKLLLGDEGWLLLRRSGTEPVLRVYAEARSPGVVQELLQAGVRHLGQRAQSGAAD